MRVDNGRLLIAVERDDTTRLAVIDVDDAWPRRLAVHTATSGPTATRASPRSRPTARGPGTQTFCGWKSSGATGKGGLGRYYLAQFMREQSRTVVG